MLITIVATALLFLSKSGKTGKADPDSLRHRQTITQDSARVIEERAAAQMRETVEPSDEDAPRKFLTLFVLGTTMFVGLILVGIATMISQGGSTSFGRIIFIGPIPIVFGAGPGAQWLILFAIILAVLGVIMFLNLRRKPGIMQA